MGAINKVTGSRGVDLLPGETVTLAASGARTADGNGSWIYVGGERSKIMWVLDITASATDAGDTLDVFIDVSLDGSNQLANVVHFTQQAGNGSAATEVATIDALAPGTSTVVVTADASAAAVRPGVTGPYYRARWEVVDSGDGNSSHTFSVEGYALR